MPHTNRSAGYKAAGELELLSQNRLYVAYETSDAGHRFTIIDYREILAKDLSSQQARDFIVTAANKQHREAQDDAVSD